MQARVTLGAARLTVAMLLVACASLAALPLLEAGFAVVLAGLSWWLAASDLDRFELPDLANLSVAAIGLIWIIMRPEPTQGIVDAAQRSLAGGAFLALVKLIYARVRGVEGLGWGDVKLLAAGAVWLDWPELPVALLMAALAGLCAVAARTNLVQALQGSTAVPFGAFLAPSIWITWVLARAGLI